MYTGTILRYDMFFFSFLLFVYLATISLFLLSSLFLRKSEKRRTTCHLAMHCSPKRVSHSYSSNPISVFFGLHYC